VDCYIIILIKYQKYKCISMEEDLFFFFFSSITFYLVKEIEAGSLLKKKGSTLAILITETGGSHLQYQTFYITTFFIFFYMDKYVLMRQTDYFLRKKLWFLLTGPHWFRNCLDIKNVYGLLILKHRMGIYQNRGHWYRFLLYPNSKLQLL